MLLIGRLGLLGTTMSDIEMGVFFEVNRLLSEYSFILIGKE